MKRSRLLLTTLAFGLLLATSAPVIAADNDGDGYDSTVDDCDDTNEFINPGAAELAGDQVDQNCDGLEDCYADADDDGYRTTATITSFDLDCVDSGEALASDPSGDCDDNAASVNPGATEVVDDGIDQDCNGMDVCYRDTDDDGYRTDLTVNSIDFDCVDAGEGRFTDPSGDCDDSDSGVNPAAQEVCDAGDVDEDCDGVADDADASAVGQTSWYTDADADGYGTGGAVLACDAPAGHSATSDDCDDSNASIHPAATEVCDAGDVDEDCDGLADDADASAVGQTSWYTDADGDGYGTGGGVVACDAPSGSVGNDGDCDDADAAISPGDPEICDASAAEDEDCDGLADCDDSSCSSEPSCLGTVEVFDHLECFKIKTTEKLKGTVDLDPGTNPPFALAPGCTITKAKKYCVPVTKTVVAVDTTLTPNPAYVGQELTDDRICYKVKCPDAAVGTITVEDQFGVRDFEKFKAMEICTPAQQVP